MDHFSGEGEDWFSDPVSTVGMTFDEWTEWMASDGGRGFGPTLGLPTLPCCCYTYLHQPLRKDRTLRNSNPYDILTDAFDMGEITDIADGYTSQATPCQKAGRA